MDTDGHGRCLYAFCISLFYCKRCCQDVSAVGDDIDTAATAVQKKL